VTAARKPIVVVGSINMDLVAQVRQMLAKKIVENCSRLKEGKPVRRIRLICLGVLSTASAVAAAAQRACGMMKVKNSQV
jgi:hypothetical protein